MTNKLELNDSKVKKKKRSNASLDKRKARAGWIFVLPFVIGFVLIYIPIIYESISSSMIFLDRDPKTGQIVETFVGWRSYAQALTATTGQGDFLEILIAGVTDMILDIPMILLFSLFMAVLLNQKMAGRAAFRAIFFVPVILSTGIMTSLGNSAIDAHMGSSSGINTNEGGNTTEEIVSSLDVQNLFEDMAIGNEMLTYVTDIINRIYDIVNRSGVQMLIFLAGLQSISPAIYESVQIDGATSWETFWKITFPMISPMILVNAIYTVIDAFTVESSVMKYISNAKTGGIVGEASAHPLPVATAMSWIYFLVVILVLGLVAAIFSSYVFYQKKK